MPCQGRAEAGRGLRSASAPRAVLTRTPWELLRPTWLLAVGVVPRVIHRDRTCGRSDGRLAGAVADGVVGAIRSLRRASHVRRQQSPSGHPRPIYGALVAMMVMNWIFASSGKLAM
jgi:hypothetical protein